MWYDERVSLLTHTGRWVICFNIIWLLCLRVVHMKTVDQRGLADSPLIVYNTRDLERKRGFPWIALSLWRSKLIKTIKTDRWGLKEDTSNQGASSWSRFDWARRSGPWALGSWSGVLQVSRKNVELLGTCLNMKEGSTFYRIWNGLWLSKLGAVPEDAKVFFR